MTTLADIFIRLIGSLPLPVIRILGALLGFVLAKLPTRLKQTTELQLARCLPEMSAEDRARVANDSLLASAHAIVEAPAIWFGPISRRQRWIANSDEPLNTIRQAHAAGSGVILLTPHQGAWELASFFCAQVALAVFQCDESRRKITTIGIACNGADEAYCDTYPRMGKAFVGGDATSCSPRSLVVKEVRQRIATSLATSCCHRDRL